MGLTNYPNGIQTPMTTSAPHWLPNGGSVYFVGSVNASDDNVGTNYDRPLARISKATVDKVVAARGDIVFVGGGYFTENVKILNKNNVRIVGAGIGLTNLKPGDTAATQTTDAAGQSTTPNFSGGSAGISTTMTDIGIMIASRGVVVSGMTIHGTGNAAAGVGGIYIGDGGRINSSYDYGASQCHISNIFFEGSDWGGGWAIMLDGLGPGTIIEDCTIARWASGGVFLTSGLSRATIGTIIRRNHFIACRRYGVFRPASVTTAVNDIGPSNVFSDDGTTNLTNGVSLGASNSGEDHIFGNYFMTANAGFSALSTDWQSGNYRPTAGTTVDYVSVA